MAVIKGFSFPFRVSPRGGMEESTGIEKIKGNLRALVLTALGERLMSPDVGTLGYNYLFSNIDSSEFVFLKQDIKSGIERGERRVAITDVRMTQPNAGGQMLLEVDFILTSTMDQQSISVSLEA